MTVLVLSTGFTGCGANPYAASGRPALEDSDGPSALLANAANAGSTESAPRMSRTTDTAARRVADTMPPETRTLNGEIALRVEPGSSLKIRRQVQLQSLVCANPSITGAGTNNCTVALSSGAPSGGLAVALSSNNVAVSVPASITVPQGASSATFAATFAAVSTAQPASISATANGSTMSYSIQLNACAPSLAVSSNNVSFGGVSVGQTATSSVVLTSSGNAPLTISSISVAGSLFKPTGVTLPLTLNPGQTAALTLQFYADHVSSFTGIVTISSNATQGTATINMSGDGVAIAPTLKGLTCTDASVTGSEADGCSVSLSSTAPSGGVTVALSSNNAAVAVPASVTIPAGASSAGFSTAISAVTSAQTASITGTANGSAKSFGIQLNAASAALSLSSTSVSFGPVVVGQTATTSVTLKSSGNASLTISSISVAGSLFKATGLATPMTLNPGQTATLTLQFFSDHTSSFTGVVTISSNSGQGGAGINMSADGVPALSGLTCNTQSYSAAGTDSCLVSLVGTAPDTGYVVSLASNNSSVAVPASVTVPAGAMSASFSANVSAVTISQSATLSASTGGVTKNFSVQLGPVSSMLTADASSVPFGSVLVNSPSVQSITLKSSGTSAVTINSIAISGAGFTDAGVTTPMTLNPGQTAVLNVQFTPTTAGSFSGLITIGSNSSAGGISIALSGTGYKHNVQLNWSAAPSSAVTGYNVYRALSGSTGYQRLNSAAVATTAYADGNVQSGASYVYYVTSVDGSGRESVGSNTTSVAVPNP